jgi:hypothetical protein
MRTCSASRRPAKPTRPCQLLRLHRPTLKSAHVMLMLSARRLHICPATAPGVNEGLPCAALPFTSYQRRRGRPCGLASWCYLYSAAKVSQPALAFCGAMPREGGLAHGPWSVALPAHPGSRGSRASRLRVWAPSSLRRLPMCTHGPQPAGRVILALWPPEGLPSAVPPFAARGVASTIFSREGRRRRRRA